jgi:hypothetical protein
MRLEVLVNNSRLGRDNRGELCDSGLRHGYKSVDLQVSMAVVADSQSREGERDEKTYTRLSICNGASGIVIITVWLCVLISANHFIWI